MFYLKLATPTSKRKRKWGSSMIELGPVWIDRQSVCPKTNVPRPKKILRLKQKIFC